MTSTARSLQNTWNTAWETAPPAACQTLRNLNNNVAWGQTCIFAEEDGDPLPFSINTACMPWVTPNVYPSASAFYSPATACPTSWTAVATMTTGGAGEQWVNGETAINCCPDGFVGDGGSGCKQGSVGTWPVVECGEADAEENELRTYSAVSWPTAATASFMALQLRYKASDIGSESATGGLSSSPSGSPGTGSGRASNNSDGRLSTGAIIAIATVIPLVFIIGAVVAFFLWRRRKHHKEAAALLASKNMTDDTPGRSPGTLEVARNHNTLSSDKKSAHMGVAGLAGVTAGAGRGTTQHETPEWNVELDASELERQKLVSAAPLPGDLMASGEVSELGGLMRVPRKPIAPVEIDSNPVTAEVGDAYIPYRPGSEGR